MGQGMTALRDRLAGLRHAAVEAIAARELADARQEIEVLRHNLAMMESLLVQAGVLIPTGAGRGHVDRRPLAG